ncbi:hypothetical protein ES703_14320 [subsurface metagenome]
MSIPIKSIITGCLIKFTSIVDKVKNHDITLEQSRDLLVDLAQDTTAEVSKRTRENFVTDN